MVRLHKRVLQASLGCLIVLGVAVDAEPDTLFKARQPVKIGHGKEEGAKIHWTNCSGQNPETFDEPPYSLDLADNCSVSPSTFGLECEGESCKVVDAATLQKYIPHTTSGQKVRFQIDQHQVKIQSDSGSIQLER